uniref:hypothetical protein n=1 Tax=Thaumasiovibrio occultus TaxID=1891184 RepID=UPI000B357E50|nr:hypothetical protein [Thaumasiovibrio occultus]
MMKKISVIDPKKIPVHLKLGRTLVQFIGINEYFGSKTFDWLELRQADNQFHIKLKQGLDMLYDLSPCLEEFETVETLEGDCDEFYSTSLEACFEWGQRHYSGRSENWSLDIIAIYNALVDEQQLGQ